MSAFKTPGLNTALFVAQDKRNALNESIMSWPPGSLTVDLEELCDLFYEVNYDALSTLDICNTQFL